MMRERFIVGAVARERRQPHVKVCPLVSLQAFVPAGRPADAECLKVGFSHPEGITTRASVSPFIRGSTEGSSSAIEGSAGNAEWELVKRVPPKVAVLNSRRSPIVPT
jgi:hypothetical protein